MNAKHGAGLLHLVSDWLRASTADRDRFLESTPAERIDHLRKYYSLDDGDLHLVMIECKEKIAEVVEAIALAADPGQPAPWNGARYFYDDTSSPPSAMGPGWGGPQWSCVESVSPPTATRDTATTVEVAGWMFDAALHTISFDTETSKTPMTLVGDVTPDRYGHFAATGSVTLPAGTYSISIRASTKPGNVAVAGNVLPQAFVVA